MDNSIQEQSYNRLLTNFLMLSVLTLSLYIVKIIDGFSISFALLFVLSYIFISLKEGVTWELFQKVVVFVLFFLFIAVLHMYNIDTWEYIKSFLLSIVTLFIFFVSVEKKADLFSSINFKQLITVSIYCIVGFELIQIIEQLILGTHQTWFLLDAVSISTATEVDRFQSVNFLNYFRPVSVFHEPSYMAVVLFILLNISYLFEVSSMAKYLAVFGILFSMSTSIILFLFIFLFLKTRYKVFVFLFSLLFILLAIIYLQVDIKEYLRLSELVMEGTSGNERLVLPLKVVYEEVVKGYSFLGIPLGQSEVVFNNSFFLFFLYFGVLAPLVIFLLYIYIRNHISIIELIPAYFVGFLALLFVNGAFFTPESNLLLILLNTAYFLNTQSDVAINHNS
jgi:hypothetical protein